MKELKVYCRKERVDDTGACAYPNRDRSAILRNQHHHGGCMLPTIANHAPHFSVARSGVASILVLLGTGCGSERGAEQEGSPPGQATPAPAVQETAPPPGVDAQGEEITPEMVALGEKIFQGQEAGGNCLTCHGLNARGSQLAPDLTDGQWLNGDGSFRSIVSIVTSGVPNPKQHPAPMPPMGGASLTPEQVRAVAAYVYSLSHKIG